MIKLQGVLLACGVLAVAGCGASSGADTTTTPATGGGGGAVAAEGDSGDVSIELAFMTHLDDNLPEQDVYIEREPGSGQIYRVTKGDNNMDAQLFKTTEEVPHNPFNPKANGPYKKGEPLGMTLGTWLKQSGTGTYTCKSGQGTLKADFKNLVPNGVYTMWHWFVSLPPPVPFTGTLDLPLGAKDGSTSSFKAGADGTAKFEHTFTPCLQMTGLWVNAGLAIAYHSDQKTHGGHPGEFGLHTHIPLFLLLPKRKGLE